MGSSGTSTAALRRAYEEAALNHRAAGLVLALRQDPASSDLQRAQDARAAFATAKRAYYEEVLEMAGTPERRALDASRQAYQIACVIQNDCVRERQNASSPDLARETAARIAVAEARTAFLAAWHLRLAARRGPLGIRAAAADESREPRFQLRSGQT
jgi:hypothetical protein